MEALVRWQRPDGSVMGPCDFIPVAEECGMIQRLGAWVLREACAQARIWRSEGLPALPIAVNLSARQFLHEDLLDTVARIVEETGIDPALLELEITESLMLRNPEHASSVLQALKRMGVRLALDDFGTGYSNLSYLKRFPFDCLKIDRSFIQDVPADEGDAAIARAMIAMAHGLRLQVVAEGAESAEQIAFLRAHACDAVQGNFFSPPLGAAAFSTLLRAESRATEPGFSIAH
jgi:EAL domain-containing protein (putative c-di-GMP-specific phosphodiesterase class I)